MSAHPLSNMRIGVFGKGGTGKTTVTVFLAHALRRRGYTVVVLDADSTNIGLGGALGVGRQPTPLLDHFGGMVFSGGTVTCPVDDPTPLAGGEVSLSSLPPAFVGTTDGGIHLLVAGKLGPLGPGAGCDGPIVKIARDLVVTDLGPHPVMLVDFKAGFEDAARGAVTSVDWALVVVDATVAAVRMARHLAGLVERIGQGIPPATAHLDSPELVALALRGYAEARVRGVLAVLNRVRDRATEAYLRSRLDDPRLELIGAVPDDPEVALQWLRGSALYSRRLALAADIIATGISVAAREPYASAAK
jgi:CO dehydrogenase nickel-insertion accessory protein CooC1